jgi:hypothetical protein
VSRNIVGPETPTLLHDALMGVSGAGAAGIGTGIGIGIGSGSGSGFGTGLAEAVAAHLRVANMPPTRASACHDSGFAVGRKLAGGMWDVGGAGGADSHVDGCGSSGSLRPRRPSSCAARIQSNPEASAVGLGAGLGATPPSLHMRRHCVDLHEAMLGGAAVHSARGVGELARRRVSAEELGSAAELDAIGARESYVAGRRVSDALLHRINSGGGGLSGGFGGGLGGGLGGGPANPPAAGEVIYHAPSAAEKLRRATEFNSATDGLGIRRPPAETALRRRYTEAAYSASALSQPNLPRHAMPTNSIGVNRTGRGAHGGPFL